VFFRHYQLSGRIKSDTDMHRKPKHLPVKPLWEFAHSGGIKHALDHGANVFAAEGLVERWPGDCAF